MAASLTALASFRWRLVAALALVGAAMAPGSAVYGQTASAELVMFVEAGCPWCLKWDREVGVAYPRSAEGQRAPLRRIDISDARRTGLGLKGPVTMTPTFVLVSAGSEVGRITGYPGADFFWGMISDLVGRLPADVPQAPPRDAGAPMAAPDGARRPS